MEIAKEFERDAYPLLILESRLDSFGHMNNAAYLEVFEEARWQMITSRGYGYERVHELQVGPTILEISLRFHREVRLRQKMRVETWVESYSGKVGDLVQELRDEAGALHCTAKFKFGLFDMRARKLILPTPEWLKAMGAKTTGAN